MSFNVSQERHRVRQTAGSRFLWQTIETRKLLNMSIVLTPIAQEKIRLPPLIVVARHRPGRESHPDLD
jgi:hypothetical protein